MLEAIRGEPRVVVATSLNPKIVGANVSKILVSTDTGLQSAAPLLKGYAKVESLIISELNEFVITAPPQDIGFMCSGRVTGIKMDKGWCYAACSKCTKKLQRTDSAFTCVHCDNTHDVGALRYRVELGIADDTAEGVFVCFDGVMRKLHNLKANEAGHMLVHISLSKSDLLHTTSQQVIRLTPSHGFLTDVNVHHSLNSLIMVTTYYVTAPFLLRLKLGVAVHDQMLEQPLMVEIH
ncbi:unnamed protein product [Brassica oleracea var. botrytis]|uniref:Replication factor A C-terminal domain-containing protein n=2 Tax=Brassica TaxID=3705 RepID=A0A3P6CDL6_BRAOL|nr:unnamed protein product [Brassica napus]CDY60032.1 BnaCnng35670D [Brassica napus]VDD08665.1 unnamed protein product [Brassica oleracea]